jgi:hypothetical protein
LNTGKPLQSGISPNATWPFKKSSSCKNACLEETGKAYDGNDWLRQVAATGARRNNPIHNFLRKLRRTFYGFVSDIDKIDTNIRHAKGIIDLVIDNIGNKLDSDPDAIEFALWSAAKHLRKQPMKSKAWEKKIFQSYFPKWTPTRSAMMKKAYLNRMTKMNKPTTTSSLKSELEKMESSPI